MLFLRPRTHAVALGLLLAVTAASGQDTKPTSRPETPPVEPIAYALITTSMGDILIELNGEKAPITVANFLSYAEKGFYDGTIFHRVISNFMIQGGGLTPGLTKKKTDPPIKNEWRNGLKNTRGSIAMARLGGRPDSATAQFFINVKDNANLDMPQRDGAGYAVFGKVVAGMDVVEKIRTVDVGMKKGRQNVPIETVYITKVRRITKEDAREKIKAASKPPTSRPG